MKRQLFKTLILLAYSFNFSYTMEEVDESINSINLKCRLRCKSQNLVQDENLENYTEVEQFQKEITNIAQNALLKFQKLISTHMNLFSFVTEEQLVLKLKLCTLIKQGIRKNLEDIIWKHQSIYIINKQSYIEAIQLQKFHHKCEKIIFEIKNQLRKIDYLINIAFPKLSPITIQLKLYIQKPKPKDSSYLTNFIKSVGRIFDFT